MAIIPIVGIENGQNVIPREPKVLVVPKTAREIVAERTLLFFDEIRQAVGGSEDVEVQSYDVERFGGPNGTTITDRVIALEKRPENKLLASVYQRTDAPDQDHITVSYAQYLDEE